MHIDLNADVGEGFGAYLAGDDRSVIPLITSANVACGFHAGDPGIMRDTVALAQAHGVALGAHPSLPDLQGFGRREFPVSAREVENLVLYQVGALHAIAAAAGGTIGHVKPHGALYNMAARDIALADAVAQAVASFDPGLVLFGLAGSELIAAGRRAGLRTANEVFADRTYRTDGSLAPRSEAGAVIHDPELVAARALDMVQNGIAAVKDGRGVRLLADTICLHGDTPGAVDLARAVRRTLLEAGIGLRAVSATLPTR